MNSYITFVKNYPVLSAVVQFVGSFSDGACGSMERCPRYHFGIFSN